MTVQQALEIAIRHHQAGRLADAEAIYRQILAADPVHPDALHLLGVIAHRCGRYDVAVDLIRKAIAQVPRFPDASYNLGVALQANGQLDEAVAAYRTTIILKPDHAEAHGNLGIVLYDQRYWEEAVTAYRKAIELKPNFPEAYSNLGNALCEMGLMDQSIAACRQAISLRPDFPEACYNLGNAFYKKGQMDDAISAYGQAIFLKPDYSEAHSNLGNALKDRGSLDEVIASYLRAIQSDPNRADLHNVLGGAFKDAGQLDQAVACCRRALAIEPRNAASYSNLIYTLHFHPSTTIRSLREEHGQWNQYFAEPLKGTRRPHVNTPDPHRRLRIGYVSPDFRHHVIYHFLTPLLESHDHSAWEIYCYASVLRPDRATERMKKAADVWRDVLGFRDDALAEQIREDQIDILVDLTQHMADNRLLVFARKPAPLQVAWLGYPGSTGLEAMDYRLTDASMEPEGSPWSESVETPVRLPDSWFCFDPIDDYPEPGPLPALRAGHVTFGSFNNFCKVNDAVLELWASILQSVGGSRLLLQCPAGATQERVRQWFGVRGIEAGRIDLFAKTATRAELLQLFERIDLALEPFPYNGGTTTCEALWTGVPVPSFPGASAVSRIGLSILSAIGLPELVADSRADYVSLMVGLA